uniref:BSD domain-containing protein n=1 Tax=Leptocylindrus danicus TaxID=163516 RepID=A0A7S2KA83_9STRA|mmetsp:Transcript_20486/g.30535  ORF Transcript_20486/g.30535 Transcript_20486/m.30535 type:complete len:703 (+) Transcript_20486:129-2237(+)
MWAALRSDLSELVHAVSDQTEQLREKIIDDEHEDHDSSEQIHNNDNNNTNTNNNSDIYLDTDLTGTAILSDTQNSSYEVTGMIQSAADEASHRSTLESTYITPLDENVEDELKFIATFNCDEMTEIIAQVLNSKPKVEEMFSQLVPTSVTYEEFWQRYFYRCDVERIEMEWQLMRDLQAKKRQELMDKGRNFISGFVGSALNVVAPVVTVEESSSSATDYNERPTPSLSQHGESLYDEEDEEEELGWDESEEEDDDEDDGGDGGGDLNNTTLESHETIVFASNADADAEDVDAADTEVANDYRVQQELLTALQEEKVQLQGIIKVQKEEIAALQQREKGQEIEVDDTSTTKEEKESASVTPPLAPVANNGKEIDELKRQLEEAHTSYEEEATELKRQLEEAQVQISKLVSEQEEKDAASATANTKHEEDISSLQALITEKDERAKEQGIELVNLQNTIAAMEKVNEEKGDDVQKELMETTAKYTALQTELETYKQTTGDEIATLKDNLAVQSSEAGVKLSDLSAQIQTLEVKNSELLTELEQVQGQAQEHFASIDFLEEEKSTATTKIAALEEQLTSSTSEKLALEDEISTLRATLMQASAQQSKDEASMRKLAEESNALNATIQKLEVEVKQLKQDASATTTAAPAPTPVPSSAPSSSSSAVKVEAPSIVKGGDQEDDDGSNDDDDWGDAWGEDDENLDDL